jgi:exo-beta-1,3-glucanase (GH17 family)
MKRVVGIIFILLISCNATQNQNSVAYLMTPEQLLGNKKYQAICYGGYRNNSRSVEPTVAQIKEDLLILSAMGIKLIRTYNVHHLEIVHLLEAIAELKKEDSQFEMYVMLGAWIDCKNAWTNLQPIHDQDAIEIAQAVKLTNQYPDIIKIIAVGNEAMVKWATSYYVTPEIILKWVTYLQQLKAEQKLPKQLWITSSDNFASWGGGTPDYHTKALNELIKAVDYISVHTYPMHDTHYNPSFWGVKSNEENLSEEAQINAAMIRSRDYAINQYNSVVKYMHSLGVTKPVHIGETGWATLSNEHYGNEGSRATDEYKSALYYQLMREWTNQNNISCFYFEAFDENWKDAQNPLGSENHFGLINLQSEAKFALWNLVDEGVFKGLTRNGKPITKSFGGDKNAMWKTVYTPAALVSQ